jgi:magnesium-transporting ATPase (P-type)
VDTARHYGFVFLKSTSQFIELEVVQQKKELVKERMELLKLFEFNSDRKRMSVIVRHNGIIKLYIKGADNMILARLNKNVEQPFLESTKKRINEFSKEGLRTLLIAMRVIEEDEYASFEAEYQNLSDAPNREEAMMDLAEDIEQNLYLMGATGMEQL